MPFNLKCKAVLLVISCLVCVARADTALEQFNQIYGDTVKAATAVSDTGRQLDLATQLMSDAEQLGPDQKLKAELYLKAAEYALADKRGNELAREAIGKLQSLTGAAAKEGKVGLLPMLRQKYRSAPDVRRYFIGRLLIDALDAQANSQITAGQLSLAAPLYREAFELAEKIDPGSAPQIRLEESYLDTRRVVAGRIQGLEAELRNSPADPHRAAVLARLLLLDMNDPMQASAYVHYAGDPTLTEMVSLAAKKPEELTDDQLLKLAEWLVAQAQTEPDFAKLSAFKRAQECYARFLDLHRAEDLQHLRAVVDRDKNAVAISRLEGIKSGPVDAVAAILLVPMDQFSQRYGTAFPINMNEARGGVATSSKQYEDWSPTRLFAGERNGDEWCLDQDSGDLDVHWPTPVIGQYLLLFGRGTGSADLWIKATIQINGGKPLPLQNVSASDDILIDLGSLTRITDLRISIQGRLHPGLAAIEIHRSVAH